MHVTCCFKYLKHENLIIGLIGLASYAFHFKEEKSNKLYSLWIWWQHMVQCIIIKNSKQLSPVYSLYIKRYML